MLKLKNKIVGFFSTIGITILGMMGGQGKLGGKGTRRFGIPGIAIIAGLITNGVSWKDFVFILFIPVLIMGYGSNSWLLSVFKADWIVRLVYAMLLSIPFLFYNFKRFIFAAVCLIAAFQVRAGSIGNIGWFGDILVEDIVRYSTLGVLVAYNIIFEPRK